MKCVILAGGIGSRISEETLLKPKPLIEISGLPILWHIMKFYSAYNVNEFVICSGYKGYMIKEYFANYFLHMSDATFDLKNNKMEIHNKNAEPWKVTLVDTGLDTMTGGRLKKIKQYVDDNTFCFTYGDGLSDVNISELVDFHRSKKKISTVTAVQPPGRYGNLEVEQDIVKSFKEKPAEGGNWINGGFFVLEPSVFDYIPNDSTSWEREAMEKLSNANQLAAFKHSGFWYAMDTLREKNYLEELWNSGKAPWKVW